MAGKPEEADAAFLLEFTPRGQAAVLAERVVQQLAIVDAVQRQQVHMIEPQIFH